MGCLPALPSSNLLTGSEEELGEGPPSGHHIFHLQIRDELSQRYFLVDSGSYVSVLPLFSKSTDVRPTAITLFTANGSQIKVFGEKRMKLDLSVHIDFH